MFECIKRLFAKKEEPVAATKPPPQEQPIPVSRLPVDLEVFKRRLTLQVPTYRDEQWDGYEVITRKFFELKYEDLRQLAYCLATALHETAFTMKPVREYGSEAYLKSKPYYPWVGEGYVQLTWYDNYVKFGLEKTPKKAGEPDTAAFVLIEGMEKGMFTGVGLPKYFNWNVNDPINARRIVNGTDKAGEIANYHWQILSALSLSSTQFLEQDLSSKLNMADLT